MSGLKQSIRVSKSDKSGVIFVNNLSHFCFVLFGRDFIYFIASLFPIYFISSADGVPKIEIILWTWSKKSSPGNKGVLPKSSATIQPTDQISMAFVY